MFRVENADFIADKLSSELLPNQEFREVAKNAEEAIDRRRGQVSDPSFSGRVEFDVDWPLLDRTGGWYVACADNGDGMTRSELERYTTTLAVQGAGQNQSIRGNQGMGLKIAGPTRHKRGVLIRSFKNGERTMVQVGWNGREYGLIPLGPDGALVATVEPEMFPSFINEAGAGTVVTFLGNEAGDNTFVPAGRPKGWLFKYLHQRFFRMSADGTTIVVRVPAGEPDDWPRDPGQALERESGKSRPSFNRSVVRGTGTIWDDASDRQGEGFHGSAHLPGNPALGVPSAFLHWWVLPDGPGTDVSTRTASGGSLAVLFDNELHDWRTGGQANPFFGRLGVLYAKNRICFVLEPVGPLVVSDFARAHVLVDATPALESDAWLIWSEQFRAAMPQPIQDAMSQAQARLQAEDPDRVRRIQNRLREVMQLLRPRRFRRKDSGEILAGGSEVTGASDDVGQEVGSIPRANQARVRRSPSSMGIGAVLAQIDPDGQPSVESSPILKLEPRWVTEGDAENYALVNDGGHGLHDRAAALVGEDGLTATILLLNLQFRGYQVILAAVNDLVNPEGEPQKAERIESYTQEWVEQKMIEAVHGLRQLENGSTWLSSSFENALNPAALTAAFMADRYHTFAEVRRQAGPLRAQTPPRG
ncbi:MAG: ATP-binding protein [Dehalococcoidia bacterium]|nr:ATP-binding protein [Dehalococcoidia bacterium]